MQTDRQLLYQIKLFNAMFRDECLNVHRFDDFIDMQTKLQTWQQEYGQTQLRQSLNEFSPLEYKAHRAKLRSEIACQVE